MHSMDMVPQHHQLAVMQCTTPSEIQSVPYTADRRDELPAVIIQIQCFAILLGKAKCTHKCYFINIIICCTFAYRRCRMFE